MRSRTASLLGALLLASCGGAAPEELKAGDPPPSDPAFPEGFEQWPSTKQPVVDEAAGEVRHLYHSPGARADAHGRFPVGTVLVKVHHDLGDRSLVTRIDVRRRTDGGPYDGWTYESYDAASRKALPVDAETCQLCHAAAPADGTYTRFQ
jgi:hypothetical protein